MFRRSDAARRFSLFDPKSTKRPRYAGLDEGDPGNVFMRDLGRVAKRNLHGLGIGSGTSFADFNQAVPSRGAVVCMQAGSQQSIPTKPWFRRFYFDEVSQSSFEVAL